MVDNSHHLDMSLISLKSIANGPMYYKDESNKLATKIKQCKFIFII